MIFIGISGGGQTKYRYRESLCQIILALEGLSSVVTDVLPGWLLGPPAPTKAFSFLFETNLVDTGTSYTPKHCMWPGSVNRDLVTRQTGVRLTSFNITRTRARRVVVTKPSYAPLFRCHSREISSYVGFAFNWELKQERYI